MKFLPIFLALFLIGATAAGTSRAQEKTKDKNKKTENVAAQKPLEIKANVAVLGASGKNYADDVELKDVKVFEDGVEQKITYFERKKPVLNLGLLIDNSGSLRLQNKKVLGMSDILLDNLRATDEAFVLRFVSRDKISIEQDWASDKSLLKKALQGMVSEGGQSAVLDALYLAGEKILEREMQEKDERFALVVISDFEDRDSYYDLARLQSLYSKSDAQIFVVALTRDLSDKTSDSFAKVKNPRARAENLAHTVALLTGGSAYVLSDFYKDEELIAVLKALIAELRSQYVIGYTPANQNRDGKKRKLVVEVADNAKGEKRVGFIRESFVVPVPENNKERK